MDWSNKEVLHNPNLSYTSRDYASIYEELKAAIPNLTSIYDPKDEADPGIVLIKLMSMLGDMLSFTSDNNALEAFPQTVIQPANAQQIFRLVGYKMRWYRSARCIAYFTNVNSVPITIGRYNTFTTSNGITYTNLNQLEIPAGASGNNQVETELVQGTPVTPTVVGNSLPVYYTGEWHDNYSYNVDVSKDVSGNRIYISDENVDGSTIVLVDDDSTAFASTQWTLVDNINTVTDVGKYFEFDFSSSGTPYIQLPEYWSTRYAITRFKLFYVVSNGEAGEISENALSQIGTGKIYIQGAVSRQEYLENLHIYNNASSYGYSPETPQEARKSAELYKNTIDTLVTTEDFTKATKRIDGIANAIATDKQTDPDGENMVGNQIKIYAIRKPGYAYNYVQNNFASTDFTINREELNDDIWKNQIVTQLENHKLSRYDIQVALESSIDWIDWTIEGSIWLRQPVPSDKNHDIMVKIDNNLDYTFSPSVLDFNEAINYIDVIDNIKSSDKLIYHVDLNSAAIRYSRIRRDTNGNPTGLTVEKRWRIYDYETKTYTQYYVNGFGCAPTPGGDGTDSGSGYRIRREDGSTTVTGLKIGDIESTEYEIYNDKVYCWVQERRIDTGYIVDHTDPLKPVIRKATGDTTPIYYLNERLSINLSDGEESTEYMITNKRDVNGVDEGSKNYDSATGRAVYDIYDDTTGDWTGKFIDRDTGEIFIIRNGRVYSMKRYYKSDSGEIVDNFGDPILISESEGYARDEVAKEELTGRYEQTLDIQESGVYDFYLGQASDGSPLKDSVGNDIDGFPIKPNGLSILINIDQYMLHDTGKGIILGSSNILNGPGSIDYTTGHVKFKLTDANIAGSIKIIYYKNTIAMARYTPFDTDKFYTQPQFLRYSNANRSLG